ncbi:MAG: alpha-glucan family phosphorylase [Bacillota bacterium]
MRTFMVTPSLPPELHDLETLAYNLWWSWHYEAIDLFRGIDPGLWEKTEHNPVRMLGILKQKRLDALARDEKFLHGLSRVMDNFARYIGAPVSPENGIQGGVAYFSAEYGITECLPIYSGGLGILAGDHLKSASDLGLPLVGIGLLYQQGYFRQYLNADGWQNELYPINDLYNIPVKIVYGAREEPLIIPIPLPGRAVKAQIWKAQVGRIPLYLLDTNMDGNCPEHRRITAELYGGDMEYRIQQEIVLGVGGVRLLKALGVEPGVFHLNEGHSAFLNLERIRNFVTGDRLSPAEAVEAVRAGSIFTTHTPVSAGIDIYPAPLIRKYFAELCQETSFPMDKLLALGRPESAGENAGFSMAVLALRLSSAANGVSELHGEVSRRLWKDLWPQVPPAEIPIGSITNGVHFGAWVSHDMGELYDKYLGAGWREHPESPAIWEKASEIPDGELWRVHEKRREKLVAFARQRLRLQFKRQGGSAEEILHADEILSPEILTIGFARRFATYKRANLILTDLDRLIRILTNKDFPMQIIFAGKAHPLDNPGKELIREIVRTARDERLRRRMVFLEDYDETMARFLVQGVDVWLNNPRRPMEASGTSGMKAAANGVLNLSTLDGWWAEGYRPEAGWAIGSGECCENAELQDRIESRALYDLLEKVVAPLFYERDSGGLPLGWIKRMKASLKDLCPFFNTHRMVSEYLHRYYRPLSVNFQDLTAHGMAGVKNLWAWRGRLHAAWPGLRLSLADEPGENRVPAGTEVPVAVRADLGDLAPGDVKVEAYYGPLDEEGAIFDARITELAVEERLDGGYTYKGFISCETSGRWGYAVRLLPHHPNLGNPFEMGLIKWL